MAWTSVHLAIELFVLKKIESQSIKTLVNRFSLKKIKRKICIHDRQWPSDEELCTWINGEEYFVWRTQKPGGRRRFFTKFFTVCYSQHNTWIGSIKGGKVKVKAKKNRICIVCLVSIFLVPKWMKTSLLTPKLPNYRCDANRCGGGGWTFDICAISCHILRQGVGLGWNGANYTESTRIKTTPELLFTRSFCNCKAAIYTISFEICYPGGRVSWLGATNI